ncbi:S8 family serine peptidase, partial [Bacillus sp. D-CC]
SIWNVGNGIETVDAPTDQPVTMTLERATKLGVTAVVSNGNDGPKPWSVDAPGNASSVISVGASTVSIPFP